MLVAHIKSIDVKERLMIIQSALPVKDNVFSNNNQNTRSNMDRFLKHQQVWSKYK